jgi:flagellar protein FlaG
MNQPATPDNPRIVLKRTDDYRDSYANSVQVRLSVWDFLLVFGTISPQTPEQVEIENFQGVYLSPQQAKALHNILGVNLAQYEQAFGPIALEPVPANIAPFKTSPGGPVH